MPVIVAGGDELPFVVRLRATLDLCIIYRAGASPNTTAGTRGETGGRDASGCRTRVRQALYSMVAWHEDLWRRARSMFKAHRAPAWALRDVLALAQAR
jgi:hypothetical protein